MFQIIFVPILIPEICLSCFSNVFSWTPWKFNFPPNSFLKGNLVSTKPALFMKSFSSEINGLEFFITDFRPNNKH